MTRGAPPARLRCLDVLRGFAMFWIVGGREIALAVTAALGWLGAQNWFDRQLHHAEWNGFTLWDQVFPLFLFLAGASLPFSFAVRRARGASDRDLAFHAARRGLALVALGVIYNGLLAFEFESLRTASVLGRIGLAWTLAAWISLRADERRCALVGAAILVLYGILLALPVGDSAFGSMQRGSNWVDVFDQRFLPGRLHREVHDPEGWLGMLPASVTALLGVLAGRWMQRHGESARSSHGLIVAGVALALAGVALHFVQPINKSLWTPAFTSFSAGLSTVGLGAMHFVLDGPRNSWRSILAVLCAPLGVIGALPLIAYLAWRFVDFESGAHLLFGKAVEKHLVHPLFDSTLGGFVLLWIGLVALSRRARTASWGARNPGSDGNSEE